MNVKRTARAALASSALLFGIVAAEADPAGATLCVRADATLDGSTPEPSPIVCEYLFPDEWEPCRGDNLSLHNHDLNQSVRVSTVVCVGLP